MSAPAERILKLMAYADGELTGAERAEVEAMLASDPDAVRFVNDLAELGGFVSLGHGDSPKAKSIASFDIADAVMSKVAETKPDPKPAQLNARVTSLEAARARQRRQLKVGAAVAAALALAASVFLMTKTKEIPLGSPVAQMKPIAQEPSQTHVPTVEVDAVGSPGHSVSVFYLPSANEMTTSVVVWVDETGEK